MPGKRIAVGFCRFLFCAFLVCSLFAAKSSADNIENVSGNVQLVDFQPSQLTFSFVLDTTTSTVLPRGNVITFDGMNFTWDQAISGSNLFNWSGPDGSLLQIGDYDYFEAFYPTAAATFPSPGNYPAVAVYMNCGTLSFSICGGGTWGTNGSVEIKSVADGDPRTVLLLGACLPFLAFLAYLRRNENHHISS